jgi:hypothetical protein
MNRKPYSGLSLEQIQNQYSYKNKYDKLVVVIEERNYIKTLSPKALIEYIKEREQEVFLEKI